jgi:hypothetical protein
MLDDSVNPGASVDPSHPLDPITSVNDHSASTYIHADPSHTCGADRSTDLQSPAGRHEQILRRFGNLESLLESMPRAPERQGRTPERQVEEVNQVSEKKMVSRIQPPLQGRDSTKLGAFVQSIIALIICALVIIILSTALVIVSALLAR